MSAPDYSQRGTWCPHGEHIYVPERADEESTAFVEADPWPCAECDPEEVARLFAEEEDEALAYEAAWLESLT